MTWYADSHVHLDRYSDAEAEAMVRRARDAGVGLMLTVGADAASSARGVALASRLSGVLAAVGLHPAVVLSADVEHELAGLHRLIMDHPAVVRAIGEIGFDLLDDAQEAGQQAAFQAQLALARARGLPVVIHSVGGHGRTAAMLREARHRLPAVVVHYFMGDAADARRFLALDCHISFGRPVLKPGFDALREAARLVPDDRLLVETDTYPLPGRTTEPRDVVEVVRALAALRGVDQAAIARRTFDNLRRLVDPDAVDM